MITKTQRDKVQEYLKEKGTTPYDVLWVELNDLASELKAAELLSNKLSKEEVSMTAKKEKLDFLIKAIKGIDSEIQRELTNHLSPTRTYISMFQESLWAIHHPAIKREVWPRSEDEKKQPKLGDRHLKDNLDILLEETLNSLCRSCEHLHNSLGDPNHGRYYKPTFNHILTRGGLRTFFAAGFRKIATTAESEISQWLTFLNHDVFGYAKSKAGNPYRKWIYTVAGETNADRDAFVKTHLCQLEMHNTLIVKNYSEEDYQQRCGYKTTQKRYKKKQSISETKIIRKSKKTIPEVKK